MSGWVYVFGEVSGKDLLIGHSPRETLGEIETAPNYCIIGGVRADATHEQTLRQAFAGHQRDGEYFKPAPAIVEWAAWFRAQWYTVVAADEPRSGAAIVEPELWLPAPDHRLQRPEDDPTKLVQDYAAANGALPGPWAWFPNPTASFQDYFTPPEIVDAARQAMGSIDLDAASHWAANKVHKIPNYFNATISAFDHDWFGNVWLNPPYGNNAPWFERALLFYQAGTVKQLCMISPVWAFTTQLAGEFMRTASGTVLLAPTPKFWGNAEGREGTNQPHAIVYLGPAPNRFFEAFAEYGIPMLLNP